MLGGKMVHAHCRARLDICMEKKLMVAPTSHHTYKLIPDKT